MASDLMSAADVARGVCRLFAQQGLVAIPEVPLPNGRRTDLTAIDARGQITIVEIKVSRADLLADLKTESVPGNPRPVHYDRYCGGSAAAGCR